MLSHMTRMCRSVSAIGLPSLSGYSILSRRSVLMPDDPCPHRSLRSGWGVVFLNDAMKQFLQILVVRLQAAHNDIVHLREFEECLGGPVGGDLDAILATTIVVENLYTFKA